MIDPNHVDALATKGAVLANMDDEKEAIVLFDKALEIDPNSEYAKNLRAMTSGTKEEIDSDIFLALTPLFILTLIQLILKIKSLLRRPT